MINTHDIEELKRLDMLYDDRTQNGQFYLSKRSRFYRKIYKIFYIIERIPFTLDLVLITGEILSRIAPNEKEVIRAWKKWVIEHRPKFKEKFTFGKFEGEEISEVPDDYILWISNNCELPDQLEDKIKILSLFDYDNLRHYYCNHGGLYTTNYLLNLYKNGSFSLNRSSYYTRTTRK